MAPNQVFSSKTCELMMEIISYIKIKNNDMARDAVMGVKRHTIALGKKIVIQRSRNMHTKQK